MTTVIGVDLALTRTGMVTWRDGRIFVASIVTEARQDMDHRRHLIAMRILAQLDPGGWEQTCVSIEDEIIPPEARKTDMAVAGLRAVVEHALWTRGVLAGRGRQSIHPATLKVYATGRGDAPKSRMISAAQGRLSIPVANDDEADAAWLMAMTLEHLGKPLCDSLPNHNRLAIGRVAWSGFTLENGASFRDPPF